ncbi:hypothetical protein [Cellulophaga sp. BC115SP]|uniref:hypothetical protein n=1 Tax=Cellulophaga sp. BC115SP TaxID=2683263 RepID=UPI001412A194|nr:hypothetical protein [Cellulophaga sp. BC115SP]NBB31963.1 hypothetical protein [Cellulophaga sp. BC115SP]
MEFKDTGTLELKGQTGDLDKKLKDLNDNAKALRKTIKEIEENGGKGSENWKKYKQELKDTQQEAEKLSKSMKSMDVNKMTIQQLEQHTRALNKELKQLEPGTKAFIETSKRLGDVEKRLGAVKDEVNDIKKGAEELGKQGLWEKIAVGIGKVNLAFKAVIALQIIQWAVDLGKAIFGTTQKLEKYETTLKVALGSQKLAKESMAALKDIAAKTPFSLDTVTEAYVKMVNRGLRPTKEQMLSMGDVASALDKPLEQLNEAILDVSNSERWGELGISVKKSGDKIIGSWKGQTVTMEATQEGAMKMVAAFGQMKGVVGMNAQMMNKLEGQTSNLGDTFMQLAGAVGEQLKPVFYALLAIVINVANFLLELAQNSEPVVTVFKSLFQQVTNLYNSMMGLVQQIFPSLSKQTVSATAVMKGLAVVFQSLLLPVRASFLAIQAMIESLGALMSGGKALVKFLQGDFVGASKTWDDAKKQFSNMTKHANDNFTQIKKGFKDALVDTPKKLEPEAVLAAATTENKKQNVVTEEQKKAAEKRAKEAEKNRKKDENEEKKHLEQIAKANEEALKRIAEYEAETNINSIRDELEREIAKINEKARKRKAENEASMADKALKEKLETIIEKEAEAERQKVRDEYKAKESKKQEEAAQKRLETEKLVQEQEKKAESALLDWKEVQAGTNARKLVEIRKERLALELKYTQEKLDTELQIEKKKAEREISDTQQKEAALKAIEERYQNEKKAQTAKYTQEIGKLDKDLIDGKVSKQKAWSDVFSAFLKGDVNKAVEAAGQIVQGEAAAWQKRLQNNQEKFQMVGQMAMQAANFLADLEKAKADKAIAEAMRERDEKVAILQQQLNQNSADLNAAIDNERSVKQQHTEAIKQLKDSETSRIKDLEKILQDDTMEKADKIKAFKESYSESFLAMKDAETEKVKQLKEEETERLQNLEQTLNEQVWDLESQMRVATDKAEKEALEEKIRKAKKEKEEKMDAAEKTMKAAIKAAEDERDAKIKAGQQQLKERLDELDDETKQDKALSKERIEQAKQEMDDKIKAAEKEKAEKVKAATDEKNRQIKIKMDLEAAIKAENERARQIEKAEKLKAWQAQKKADTASAIITGALATIKALASGFWPVNLVFAAMSAVMTGIQVAKINSQPQPQFHYGFTPQGSKHEKTYGKGGIALVDNKTGKELGEMEGGEAIVNADQTEINQPIIKQMHENAKRGIKKPVWQTMNIMGEGAKPLAFKNGITSLNTAGRMYQYGTILKRYDDGSDGSFTADSQKVNESEADVEKAKQLGDEQIKLLREQNEALKKIVQLSENGVYLSNEIRMAVNQNVGATRGVETAIRQTNVYNKMDTLIGMISNLNARVK